MWKYRKELYLAFAISLLNLVFTLLIKNVESPFSSIYVHILNDYAYIFCFIFLLFINLYPLFEENLIVYRFKSVEHYLTNQLIKKAKSYSIIFILFSIFQISLFFLVDKNFNVLTLLYRNTIFYILILLTDFIVIVGKKNKFLFRIIVLFFIWITFYLISILIPTALINNINVFTLLQRMNLSEIFRYSILLFAIIVINFLRISKKERYISKWLD